MPVFTSAEGFCEQGRTGSPEADPAIHTCCISSLEQPQSIPQKQNFSITPKDVVKMTMNDFPFQHHPTYYGTR